MLKESDSIINAGIDVLWIAKCRYRNGQKVHRHFHKFYQLMYVVNGEGFIHIGETSFTLRKDSVYMIPASVSHEFIAGDELQTMEVKFDVESDDIRYLLSQLPEVMCLHSSVIKLILEIMIGEGQESSHFYMEVIHLKFCELLIRLYRQWEHKHDALASKAIESDFATDDDPIFQPVISFIRDNMNETITLDMLADIACLEKTYFSKKFKEKYGDSPIRFLNNMRLSKAKELLKYSHKNITQISQETGFQTLHYFSRFFTQKEGISPYEYRQKYTYDVYLYFEEENKLRSYIYDIYDNNVTDK